MEFYRYFYKDFTFVYIMAIENNSYVKIHYTGKLSDDSVFDTSAGKEPLEFVMGIGMIIPGLEKGLVGMNTGDKKTVEIKSEEAYGPVHEQAIQEVPKDQFPADIELKVGMQLAAQGPQGAIPVVIKEIKEEAIIVDFNHPLAGKDLTFEVEVVESRESTEEDMAKFMPPMPEGEGCCEGNCEDEGCKESCEHKEE